MYNHNLAFSLSRKSFVLNLQTVYLCFSSTWILYFLEHQTSDTSLLVILFSICLMIWDFCINFVFFSFHLTATILTQAFLIQNKTFTLCNILVAIEFPNFERFHYIRIFKYWAFLFYFMCKRTLRREKFRDRERNSCKGPRFLFEIQRSSKEVDIERIHRNLSFGSVDRIWSHRFFLNIPSLGTCEQRLMVLNWLQISKFPRILQTSHL